MIALHITDQKTHKDFVIHVGMRDAQKLYMALREIVGDMQYQAHPNQLVAVPDVKIRV